MLDRRREIYETLTTEEKAEFRENIRLFRHPDFSKKGTFHDMKEGGNESDPYSTYSGAFKNHIYFLTLHS